NPGHGPRRRPAGHKVLLVDGGQHLGRAARESPVREICTPDSVGTCSEASCHSSGCKSRQQSPVNAVVISSSGEGDQTAESLEVSGNGTPSPTAKRATILPNRSAPSSYPTGGRATASCDPVGGE